jgi:hypothetical protein
MTGKTAKKYNHPFDEIFEYSKVVAAIFSF